MINEPSVEDDRRMNKYLYRKGKAICSKYIVKCNKFEK